jgi:D-3-phosphoglycerate dehydrogenase / 2-oxoglutarate reductase
MGVGLGMKVEAFPPHSEERFHPEGLRRISWEECLAHAEILSLRCPCSGKPVIDHQAASHRRKGAFLLNTARADPVDEEALLEASEQAQVAGYAIDVYLHGPPPDFRLVKHERVNATPHIGGFTDESVTRATKSAVRDILYTPRE